MVSMANAVPSGAPSSALSSPAAKSRAAFTPAPPPRGQQLSIYLPAHTLGLLAPWVGSRQRSGKLSAIVDRYAGLADHRPELTLAEWGIVVQLLGPFARVRDASRVWTEVLDRARDGLPLPGVDAEVLVRKLRQLVPAEQIAVLEVADRVELGTGPLRERLAAAGVEG
jgi:hypothetical protein